MVSKSLAGDKYYQDLYFIQDQTTDWLSKFGLALLGHHFGDTGKYYDQPRALNRFLDIKNFRDEGATVLAASIHLSSRTPYIYMGEEIGWLIQNMIRWRLRSVESINALSNALGPR